MKVENIAECNTFDLHEVIVGLENQFLVFFENGHFTQALLYFDLNKTVQFLFDLAKLLF